MPGGRKSEAAGRAPQRVSTPDYYIQSWHCISYSQVCKYLKMNANSTAPEGKRAFTAESLPDHPLFSGSIGLETLGARAPLRVQTIGPGDILGWSWLFPPYYWHFNAIADEPTEAIFFYGSRLRQECDRDHDFGYELFKRMSQILVIRLQATRVKWIEAAQFNPPRHGIPPDYLII